MSVEFIRNIHIINLILNHIERLHTSIEEDLGSVDLSDEDLEVLAADRREIERIKTEILKLQTEADKARKELEVRDVAWASGLLLAAAGDLLLRAETQSQV